ncbi:hypothetical protein GX563_04540 [Candidatus Bathyarchaeota archaeon]|jgi:hypothetical protein|nr:hypothetical protein [Candidatus Bathyarchaeota archaeon]
MASRGSILETTGTQQNPLQQFTYVRYQDHVLYNRSSAMSMQPQVREAVGWLVYEAEKYIILSWDRDAAPPTLHGGDPKASGLVLLRSDIIEFRRLADFLPQELGVEKCLNCNRPLKKNRVCASSQRSEKLESEGEKKNE